MRSEKLLEDIINVSIDKRPVCFACGNKEHKTHPIITRLSKKYRLLPEGLVYRLYPRFQKLDMELEVGKYDLAAKNYQKTLIIDRSLLQTRNGLGVSLACQGLCDETVKKWNIVLSEDPRNRLARRNIAIVKNISSKSG